MTKNQFNIKILFLQFCSFAVLLNRRIFRSGHGPMLLEQDRLVFPEIENKNYDFKLRLRQNNITQKVFKAALNLESKLYSVLNQNLSTC